jgi:thioredoxin reductase (NADPH)
MATTDLHGVAFPKLDQRELEILGRCPRVRLRHYRDGEVLIRRGERNFEFFVVMSGQLAIVDDAAEPPRTLAVLERGEFTGEVAQLTGGASLITATARGEVDAYGVSAEDVRAIINQSPELGDVILQAFIARREILREAATFTGLRVIGSSYSRETFRIRDFLTKNRVPFAQLDLERDPQVKTLLESFGVTVADTPIVAWGRDVVLRNPSNSELADAIGLRRPPEQKTYDLVVIGAGPAGLAAAVYAASEGLHTLVLERAGPGGQASRSMRIENYLGFPTGITGAELAERATVQAAKFGAELPVATNVAAMTFEGNYATVRFDSVETITTKCVLIATGADYRRLEAEGLERFEGCGVYYAATPLEAPACGGGAAVVVGAGNSAGQAAVFLSTQARKVVLVVRGDSLYKSMSAYLAERIEQTENIEVLLRTTVRRLLGDERLRAVETLNRDNGEVRTIATTALFSFIGAVPRADWLPPEIEKDAKGFVLTGPSLAPLPAWRSGRQPFLLETSRPGVFAAGDVRSGSIKRVAAGVGEGSTAVRLVHEYLARM